MFKKYFETGMLMSPKNISILCHSTVHPVNIHIKRPNDQKTHARCKSGMSGQRGSGHKAKEISTLFPGPFPWLRDGVGKLLNCKIVNRYK